MSVEVLKEKIVPKYIEAGGERFYRFLLMYGLKKLIDMEKGIHKGTSPELQFLDYHDQFIILYRREGEEVYLELSRVCRRLAHKIYRIMLKKKMTGINTKFLNLV
jgi:hypothetical protein